MLVEEQVDCDCSGSLADGVGQRNVCNVLEVFFHVAASKRGKNPLCLYKPVGQTMGKTVSHTSVSSQIHKRMYTVVWVCRFRCLQTCDLDLTPRT